MLFAMTGCCEERTHPTSRHLGRGGRNLSQVHQNVVATNFDYNGILCSVEILKAFVIHLVADPKKVKRQPAPLSPAAVRRVCPMLWVFPRLSQYNQCLKKTLTCRSRCVCPQGGPGVEATRALTRSSVIGSKSAKWGSSCCVSDCSTVSSSKISRELLLLSPKEDLMLIFRITCAQRKIHSCQIVGVCSLSNKFQIHEIQARSYLSEGSALCTMKRIVKRPIALNDVESNIPL